MDIMRAVTIDYNSIPISQLTQISHIFIIDTIEAKRSVLKNIGWTHLWLQHDGKTLQ